MTFVNKYMLFSVLAITCATSFVSAAEEEATSWQAAQMRAILAQGPQREKKKRSIDFRSKSFSPEGSSWEVPNEVSGQATVLGMARLLAAEFEEQAQAQGPEQKIAEQKQAVIEQGPGQEIARQPQRQPIVRPEEVVMRERCCFL